MKLLPTKENIQTLAVAYYDNSEQILKIITDTSLYFSVSPFDFQYKRLYLIGDSIYTNTNTITLSIDTPSEYEVKVNLGKLYSGLDSFNLSSNTDNSIYNNSSLEYSNALPIDILITSLTPAEKTIFLNMEVTNG